MPPPCPKLTPTVSPKKMDSASNPLSIKTNMEFNSPLTSPTKRLNPKTPSPKIICAGLEESDSESSDVESGEPQQLSTAVSTSAAELDMFLEPSKPSVGLKRKLTDPSAAPKKDASVFDFDESEDMKLPKRPKKEFSISNRKGVNQQLFASSSVKRNNATYRHTWTDDDDELSQASNSKTPASTSVTLTRMSSAPELNVKPNNTTLIRHPSLSNKLGREKEARSIREKGEHEDFNEDFEYCLASMNKGDSTEATVFLSLQSIVKKAVQIEFRNFLRRGNSLPRLFKCISTQLRSPRICAATAVFIYFMARDRSCLIPSANFISLIMPILKVKPLPADKDYVSSLSTLWPLLEEWAKVTSELINQPVVLAFTQDTFNVSYLMLEALAFTCMHKHNPALQKELNDIGCLQWIIQKVEKLVKQLSKCNEKGEGTSSIINELNRCMRILETSALYNKQNQVFIMTGGNFALLTACSALLDCFIKFIVNGSDEVRSCIFDAFCIVGRVLMNLTHDNEMCCIKLGDMNNFLELCVRTVTEIAPQYAPKDKRFDLVLMACALLMNLIENSSSLRSRLIGMTPNVFDEKTKEVTPQKTLDILTKYFITHESAARSIDEELDKELELDDLNDDMEDREASEDGRLHRGEELSEEDAFRAIQSAMKKADSHMEDSVMCSYFGLLVGCLIQRDSDSALYVKDMMPDKNFNPLIEQLNRFKEFMEMTHKKATSSKTIERIVRALQGYNAL